MVKSKAAAEPPVLSIQSMVRCLWASCEACKCKSKCLCTCTCDASHVSSTHARHVKLPAYAVIGNDSEILLGTCCFMALPAGSELHKCDSLHVRSTHTPHVKLPASAMIGSDSEILFNLCCHSAVA